MNIFLLISRFDEHGGSEEPLTVLAVELKRLGHQVTVVNQYPPAPDNQYRRRLVRNGVLLCYWPDWLMGLASEWVKRDRLVRFIAAVAAPLVYVLSAVASAISGRNFVRTRQGAQGRVTRVVQKMIHRNWADMLLLLLLDGLRVVRRPTIIHMFRPELAPVLTWARARRLSSIYYELGIPGAVGDEAIWKKRSAHLNQATLVMALTEATRDALKAVAEIQRPIVVVPPFVADAPTVVEIRAIEQHEYARLTCVTRFMIWKGVEYLLRAVQLLVQEHRKVRLVIAGGGELFDVLRARVESLGLSQVVQFAGVIPRDEIPKLMSETDIFVLPSLAEALSIATMEAMAFGKPVVATAVGGVPELVDNDVTGILVKAGDEKALAMALMRLVDSPSLRSQMGLAGRRRFETKGYTVHAFVNRMFDAYGQAMRLTAEGQ
ncbi:MAG: glycosyltransferase family 4 protein [Chloroflexi bacterium]|nr:glycosyltransferase family 4 protein [Chloroflexota bacterium]